MEQLEAAGNKVAGREIYPSTAVVTRLDVGFKFELVVILAFIFIVALVIALVARHVSEFGTGSMSEFAQLPSLVLSAGLRFGSFLTCLFRTLVAAASGPSTDPWPKTQPCCGKI